MSWKREQYPEWDGSGTIAESWYCQCGECDCRIDRFTTGEFAYSVSWEGDYLPGAENQPADSFEDAARKCWAIASHFTYKKEEE